MTGKQLECFQLHDSTKPSSQGEKEKVSISLTTERTNEASKYQYTAGLSSGQLLHLASCPTILLVTSLPASVGENRRLFSILKRSVSLFAFACLPSCQEVVLNPGFLQFVPNFRVIWQYAPCGATFCAVFISGLSRQIRATAFSHLML